MPCLIISTSIYLILKDKRRLLCPGGESLLDISEMRAGMIFASYDSNLLYSWQAAIYFFTIQMNTHISGISNLGKQIFLNSVFTFVKF